MNFNYILQVVGSFSDSDFVNWASEQKIIQDINQLHFCSSCYNLMKLCYSDRYPDGAIFKCINRTCRNTMSIRFNSWISDAKISLKQFTVILACWSEGLNIKSTSKITIVSERTINNYFAMFRSIAEKEYRSDIDKHKLGIGIVQIDESHFFKAKYNVGSGLKRDAVWVFGEIDIEQTELLQKFVKTGQQKHLFQLLHQLLIQMQLFGLINGRHMILYIIMGSLIKQLTILKTLLIQLPRSTHKK